MAKTSLTLDKVVSVLNQKVKDGILEVLPFAKDDRLLVKPEKLPEILKALKETKELSFEFLMDQTAVDYLGQAERFEVVYQLYSMTHNFRLRVKTRVTEAKAQLKTASNLWKAADWFEREIWDMYGIRFEGHPDLKRLLMYEEFQGHPLRKDYPLKGHQPIVDLLKAIVPPKEPQYQWTPDERRVRLDLDD